MSRAQELKAKYLQFRENYPKDTDLAVLWDTYAEIYGYEELRELYVLNEQWMVDEISQLNEKLDALPLEIQAQFR